jgi:DNA processing protein
MRRTWLLGKLSVRLDFLALDLSRFWSTLELPDLELIEAIGGRRREELRAAYEQWTPAPARADRQSQALCKHHATYPTSLRDDALAPHALEVRGGLEGLPYVRGEQIVAIVGTRRATDYGMELARELARGLAASGVTVASGLAEGIPSAVHTGALEADGKTITVIAGGVDSCTPAWCTPLYRRIVDRGCAISECHTGPRARRWWQYARIRTLALLAQLVIVVEAGEQPWELACATVAWSHGRRVAAVPGRVCSPASTGANALLINGARLIRNPQDALDLLYGVGVRDAPERSTESPELEPQLARTLDRVSGGEDTLAKLTARGAPSGQMALALAQLELEGLLLRGDGGRYVPCAGASLR